jgi:Bacterial Ig-like domain
LGIKVFNTSSHVLAALLALTSWPVFSQLTGDDGPQQNTTIAKTTPAAAVKSGKSVKMKSGKGTAKSSGKNGSQTSEKSKSPAPPASPRVTNTVPPKPAVPLSQNLTPIITYLSQDAKEWMRTGEMVHIIMQGTPGGTATFRVIGLTESIAMQESAPGRYIGTWTVPVGKAFPMTRAMIAADLSLNGKSATTMQASRPLSLDTVPPLIQNVAPVPQTSVTTATPTLSADLSDEGSGIDLSATRLIINGRDLSGEAKIASDHITYKPSNALSTGEQTVQIIVSDRAGNTSQQTWHFTVNAN